MHVLESTRVLAGDMLDWPGLEHARFSCMACGPSPAQSYTRLCPLHSQPHAHAAHDEHMGAAVMLDEAKAWQS